jgi:3-oxoacyl-[acyl-carrier protein] reductase
MTNTTTTQENDPMTDGQPATRVGIVTGGSGGIGRAVAGRLAADGLKVVIAYAGNRPWPRPQSRRSR